MRSWGNCCCRESAKSFAQRRTDRNPLSLEGQNQRIKLSKRDVVESIGRRCAELKSERLLEILSK
jgi:hypothetical protein